MHLDFLYDLLGRYGVYAVFLLVMIEGDITLLLAGVLAHSYFFGEHSFLWVLLAGTLGGSVSDNIAFLVGREFRKSVRDIRFYQAAKPRMERLTNKFGGLSIFLSKYIYGLRWASCIFYGVGRMPYLRFMLLSLASCFSWVLILSGAGYFFSGAVIGLLGQKCLEVPDRHGRMPFDQIELGDASVSGQIVGLDPECLAESASRIRQLLARNQRTACQDMAERVIGLLPNHGLGR